MCLHHSHSRRILFQRSPFSGTKPTNWSGPCGSPSSSVMHPEAGGTSPTSAGTVKLPGFLPTPTAPWAPTTRWQGPVPAGFRCRAMRWYLNWRCAIIPARRGPTAGAGCVSSTAGRRPSRPAGRHPPPQCQDGRYARGFRAGLALSENMVGQPLIWLKITFPVHSNSLFFTVLRTV